MGCLGIVAEYNPLHNGHEYHISQAKRISGADNIIVVMSGSFVQRGEPACADKITRARWALRAGADMVFELPDVFALSCAERFASGSVRLLNATGLVDGISFGSEYDDLSDLLRASELDLNSPVITSSLNSGLSYPAAISGFYREMGLPDFCDAPNAILGIEYIRAASRYAPNFKIYPIKRVGSGYNEGCISEQYTSAAAIRNSYAHMLSSNGLCMDELSLFDSAMPPYVKRDLTSMIREGIFPSTLEGLSEPLLYALRMITERELHGVADVSEGIENVILRAAVNCSNVNELLSAVKTKRYTMARLKRICMNVLLGIDADFQKLCADSYSPLYIRVLGIRQESRYLLSELARKASIPIIISYTDTYALGAPAKRNIEIASKASRLRALAQPKDKRYIDDFSNPLTVI